MMKPISPCGAARQYVMHPFSKPHTSPSMHGAAPCLLLLLLAGMLGSCQAPPRAAPTVAYPLLKQIAVPAEFQQTRNGLTFGGDIRVGDLENRGEPGFIVYRTANSVDGGASQPCFLGAFDLNGTPLWQRGTGGEQPNRPGPVAIHDLDVDGESEVICLFAEPPEQCDPFSMRHVSLCRFRASDGQLEQTTQVPALQQATGKGPNWVHQRILIANLRGNATPQDFIIKLGKTLFAFDHEFRLLWTYFNPNDAYQNCPAYIPAVGDVDGDGKDEVNGGYYLLNEDGQALWERKLGKNMDCVLIDYWEQDSLKRAICSGFGHVMDAAGDTLLRLGEELVPHGQELRLGNIDPFSPGREMVIRYNGHRPEVHVVGQEGKLLRSFRLNDSPNHTGMEMILGAGPEAPALLFNGGALWNGQGQLVCELEGLPRPPQGAVRQGWYHGIPLDMAGDAAEELLVYNPWDTRLFLYAPKRPGWRKPKPFRPTARQYNVRLMD